MSGLQSRFSNVHTVLRRPCEAVDDQTKQVAIREVPDVELFIKRCQLVSELFSLGDHSAECCIVRGFEQGSKRILDNSLCAFPEGCQFS